MSLPCLTNVMLRFLFTAFQNIKQNKKKLHSANKFLCFLIIFLKLLFPEKPRSQYALGHVIVYVNEEIVPLVQYTFLSGNCLVVSLRPTSLNI